MKYQTIFKTACNQVIYRSKLKAMAKADLAMKIATEKGYDTLIAYDIDGLMISDYSSHLQRKQNNIKTTTIKKII